MILPDAYVVANRKLSSPSIRGPYSVIQRMRMFLLSRILLGHHAAISEFYSAALAGDVTVLTAAAALPHLLLEHLHRGGARRAGDHTGAARSSREGSRE